MGTRIPVSHEPQMGPRVVPVDLEPTTDERELLRYLADHGGVATLDSLAEHRAATRVREATADVRGDPDALELATLAHRDLPALVDAGAVRVVDNGPTTVELRHVDERPYVVER